MLVCQFEATIPDTLVDLLLCLIERSRFDDRESFLSFDRIYLTAVAVSTHTLFVKPLWIINGPLHRTAK